MSTVLRIGKNLPHWLRSRWADVRALSGDDAYERYCSHRREHHANEPLLDRRAFYVQHQQAKWSGINRCC